MARNLDPKCKQCRRVGEKLFLKGEKCFTPKCPIVRRNYPPGVHGPKGSSRLSEFGQQLVAKQKAKKLYGLLERQFSRYVSEALRAKGNTTQLLARRLEMRLDNVTYRLGFATSHDQARQIVSHGFFLVNGKPANIPSMQTKPGDTISLRPGKEKKPFIELRRKTLEQYEVPTWLSLDRQSLTGKIVSEPDFAEVEQRLDMRRIVEYYSR